MYKCITKLPIQTKKLGLDAKLLDEKKRSLVVQLPRVVCSEFQDVNRVKSRTTVGQIPRISEHVSSPYGPRLSPFINRNLSEGIVRKSINLTTGKKGYCTANGRITKSQIKGYYQVRNYPSLLKKIASFFKAKPDKKNVKSSPTKSTPTIFSCPEPPPKIDFEKATECKTENVLEERKSLEIPYPHKVELDHKEKPPFQCESGRFVEERLCKEMPDLRCKKLIGDFERKQEELRELAEVRKCEMKALSGAKEVQTCVRNKKKRKVYVYPDEDVCSSVPDVCLKPAASKDTCRNVEPCKSVDSKKITCTNPVIPECILDKKVEKKGSCKNVKPCSKVKKISCKNPVVLPERVRKKPEEDKCKMMKPCESTLPLCPPIKKMKTCQNVKPCKSNVMKKISCTNRVTLPGCRKVEKAGCEVKMLTCTEIKSMQKCQNRKPAASAKDSCRNTKACKDKKDGCKKKPPKDGCGGCTTQNCPKTSGGSDGCDTTLKCLKIEQDEAHFKTADCKDGNRRGSCSEIGVFGFNFYGATHEEIYGNSYNETYLKSTCQTRTKHIPVSTVTLSKFFIFPMSFGSGPSLLAPRRNFCFYSSSFPNVLDARQKTLRLLSNLPLPPPAQKDPRGVIEQKEPGMVIQVKEDGTKSRMEEPSTCASMLLKDEENKCKEENKICPSPKPCCKKDKDQCSTPPAELKKELPTCKSSGPCGSVVEILDVCPKPSIAKDKCFDTKESKHCNFEQAVQAEKKCKEICKDVYKKEGICPPKGKKQLCCYQRKEKIRSTEGCCVKSLPKKLAEFECPLCKKFQILDLPPKPKPKPARCTVRKCSKTKVCPVATPTNSCKHLPKRPPFCPKCPKPKMKVEPPKENKKPVSIARCSKSPCYQKKCTKKLPPPPCPIPIQPPKIESKPDPCPPKPCKKKHSIDEASKKRIAKMCAQAGSGRSKSTNCAKKGTSACDKKDKKAIEKEEREKREKEAQDRAYAALVHTDWKAVAIRGDQRWCKRRPVEKECKSDLSKTVLPSKEEKYLSPRYRTSKTKTGPKPCAKKGGKGNVRKMSSCPVFENRSPRSLGRASTWTDLGNKYVMDDEELSEKEE